MKKGKDTKEQESKANSWILNNWFKKTIYIIGWVFFGWLAFWFIIGFIEGIITTI